MEYYLPVKWVHLAAVIASGVLFAGRGVLVLRGVTWVMAAPLRYLSYAIDSLLLIAGLTLVLLLPSATFSNGWLTAKLLLLVVYIVLGSFALKRGRTRRVRTLCFLAAILLFLVIYTIARSHDPLGFIPPNWRGSG